MLSVNNKHILSPSNMMPVFIIQPRLNKIANRHLCRKIQAGLFGMFPGRVIFRSERCRSHPGRCTSHPGLCVFHPGACVFHPDVFTSVRKRAIFIQKGLFLIWGKLVSKKSNNVHIQNREPKYNRVLTILCNN